MQQTEVLKRLQTVFDGVFLDPVVVTPYLSAHEVDEWDSLVQINLIVAIEAEFKIQFRVGEVETTKNVGDLIKVIEGHLHG